MTPALWRIATPVEAGAIHPIPQSSHSFIVKRTAAPSPELTKMLCGMPTNENKLHVGKALDYAEVFRKILNRHTHEQEDILTSAVLHAYT